MEKKDGIQMLKSILVAFVLSILAFVSGLSGCDASDSSSFTTIESTDCSGALCLTADMTDTSGSCTGVINITDPSSGETYPADLTGFPVLTFPTSADTEGKKVFFDVTVSAPCADIQVQKITFDVVGLPSSTELPEFEMNVDGKQVGEINGFVSGDVSKIGAYDQIIEWTFDFVISKQTDSSHSFTLECLNCGIFPGGTSVRVCLRSTEWKIMLYDGHDSRTYVMGTPGVCQTTQF